MSPGRREGPLLEKVNGWSALRRMPTRRMTSQIWKSRGDGREGGKVGTYSRRGG